MVQRLEQVREGAVPADLASTYVDIRHALRLSWVPLLFRALAPRPGVLKAVWPALRANVVTRAFEEAADDLRARLATSAEELGAPLIEPVLAGAGFDSDDLDDIRAQVDVFHYADPKIVLCATVLALAAEGHRPGGKWVRPAQRLTIPLGTPADMPPLAMLPENPAGGIGEIFHEILEATHLPAADADLRALGRWPAFLEEAWREVAPVFRHRELGTYLAGFRDEADRMARHLPFAVDLPPQVAGAAEEAAAVTRVLAIMNDALPRLALFAATLKVALDGVQDALESPYAVEWDARAEAALEEESLTT